MENPHKGPFHIGLTPLGDHLTKSGGPLACSFLHSCGRLDTLAQAKAFLNTDKHSQKRGPIKSHGSCLPNPPSLASSIF